MSKIKDLPENNNLEDNDLFYTIDVSEGPNGGKKVTLNTLKSAVQPSNEEIKQKYEANTNTNAFTDTDKSKLDGIEANAKDDQNAAEVPYDNSDSTIQETNVQNAIDSIDSSLNTLSSDKLNRDGSQSMTGNLNLGGNDITNVGTVDGRDIATDGSKLDTIEVNAKDDQTALTVPYTPTTDLLASTNVQDAIDEIENIIYNPVIITVNKNPGTDQFSSVKAAMDSVSDASINKPYVISVEPGIYVEDQITMKPYVSIRGMGKVSTEIHASTPGVDLIIGAGSTQISNIGLTGTTSAALLRFTAADAVNTSISIDNIGFRDCRQVLVLEAQTFPSIVDMSNCTFSNTQVSTNVLEVKGLGSARAVLAIDAIRGEYSTVISHFIDVEGPNANISGSDLLFGSNGTGHFVHAEDGATVSLQATTAIGFEIGIHSPNQGLGCQIDVDGIFRSTDWDISIEHPNTTGLFIGAADNGKINIEPTNDFRMNFTDPVNNGSIGQVTVGEIRQGSRYDRIANISKLLRAGTALGIVEGGDISNIGGFSISVEAGNGFLLDQTDNFVKEITWETDTLIIPSNAVRYIFINTNGIIQQSGSPQSLIFTMPIGRVTTDNSGIRTIEQFKMDMTHLGNSVEQYLRNLGPIFNQGGTVSENGNRQLDVTPGSYNYGIKEINLQGGEIVPWTAIYQNGSGGWVELPQSVIDNAQYDNGSGTLVNIPAGEFTRHVLYASGDPLNEKYFLVYSQDTYIDELTAVNAPLPLIPSYISDSIVRMAGIIVQEGATNLTSITDLRPRIGFAAPSSTGASIHSSLIGLNSDDHPQYLLVDGSRGMSGNLNMSTNNITNIGTLNGVTVQNHSARHLPGGADALLTAAPSTTLNGNTTNAEGNANSFARSNHTHAIDNATTSVAGLLSATDKTKLDSIESNAKDDQTATEVPVTPVGDLSSTDVQSALEELQNDINIVNSSLSEVATSGNHSDLILDDGTNPHNTTKADVGLSNVDNTSDVNKPISTATQDALDLKADASSLSTVATTGDYADLLNKPDLSALEEVLLFENLAAFPLVGESGKVYIAEDSGYVYRWNGSAYTQLTDQTAIWGQVSGTLSNQTDLQNALNLKTDLSTFNAHASRHLPNGADPLATGTPSTVGTSNATGTENALARQDHVHDHGNQTTPTHHAAVTTTDNGFMSAADKVILNRLRTGFLQYTNSTEQTNSASTMQAILFQTDRNSFANGFFTKVSNTDFRADFSGRVDVMVDISAYAGNNYRRIQIQLFKNGGLVSGSLREQNLRGSSTQGSTINMNFIEEVSPNDILQIRFASPDGSTITLPIDRAYVSFKIYSLGVV